MERIHTVGRRKKSVARLFLDKGKAQININSKSYKEYFPTAHPNLNFYNP